MSKVFNRLHKKIHPVFFFWAASAGVLIGAHLVANFTFYTISANELYALLIIGIILFIISFLFRRRWMLLLIFLAGIILSGVRGISYAESAQVDNLIGSTVTIEGIIYEDADTTKNNKDISLRLDNLKINQKNKISGKIYVTLHEPLDKFKRGDKVILSGKIQKGFGGFSVTVYRAKLIKYIKLEPGDVARKIRDWFGEQIRLVIGEPEASLGVGYLVGQKRALPTELAESLRIAGLTHVVVASGYNLTILIRFARRGLKRISKFTALAGSLGLVVSFILVTGISPSMTRAGIVALLSLLAWFYGRSMHPMTILLLVAGVSLLIDPSYAHGDLGWQLSFSSFFGVMILAPVLNAYFFGDKKSENSLRQILLETLSAQICSLPILVFTFEEISRVAIFANLLVLPLIPLAMLLTFLSGVGAILFLPAGQLFGFLATVVLGANVMTASWLSNLEWAVAKANLSLAGLAISYALIVLLILYMKKKTKFNYYSANVVK